MDRTYILSSSCQPAVSGFGGRDEWTILDLAADKADEFFDDLAELVEKYGGRFTGSY